jgi:mono/diheme cytochrome c family protein
MSRILLIILALALVGCWKDDMADESHLRPMESQAAARPLINGTVPRGGRTVNDPIYAVTASNAPEATKFPFAMTEKDIERGRQQFDVFCAVCHGATGAGDGMIVQRGFPKPPSFHLDRLKNAAHGHIYNVISNGYGAMYSYGDRIEQNDRWRIVAYVRALQFSEPTTPTTQQSPAPK